MKPEEFIEKYRIFAEAVENQYFVPAVALLAIAAFRSDWGNKSTENNLFGRGWRTPYEAFQGNARLLHSDPYFHCLRWRKHPKRYLIAIWRSGYNTSPTWARKICTIANTISTHANNENKKQKAMKTPASFYLLLFTFYFLLFPSCLTVNRIQRNCDKFAQICITDKHTEIRYRDTVIFRIDTLRVPLPFRDTVKITDTVRIFNNLAFLPTVHRRFGLIGVDAGVSRSLLTVNAYLTDSTILFAHRDTILIENAIKEQTQTNTVVVEKKYIPGFYKFTFWVFILLIVIAGGYFAWGRFFKNISRKYFP